MPPLFIVHSFRPNDLTYLCSGVLINRLDRPSVITSPATALISVVLRVSIGPLNHINFFALQALGEY